jgi:glycosyltransferase involved in cell wall biosynthesis
MKKILILVDQLNSHGGIEKLVALKANYWADVFQYKVTIISTEQHQKPLVYKLSDKVKFIDLSINYHREKSYFSASNVLKFLKNIFLIQRYILKNQPDFIVVASHIPITYFLPFLMKKSKTIKEFHFTKFSRRALNFKSKVLNFIESKYDYLVVLSQEEVGFYPSSNTVVIANPIENAVIHPPRNSEKSNTAIFVGRLAPVKQLEELVLIWSKFIPLKPDWKLHVFGAKEGAYFERIQQLVAQQQLTDSFIFKGQSDAIEAELLQSKVLLLTSEQECFPMVILEAQSKGVPVISYDSPTGPRNIIHNNVDGILVEYNNSDSFVKILVQFDEDKELQNSLSEQAVRNASNYQMESIMNRWNTLLFTK